jgi:hypothetical protein
MTTYTATSLADIAKQFERRADEAEMHAASHASKTFSGQLKSEAMTWRAAADMLRQTTIINSKDNGN